MGFLDTWLVYDTVKCVRIKDRKLGAMYYAASTGIFLYIIYSTVLNKGYLEYDTVVGNVRLTLGRPQGPLHTDRLPYCTDANGNYVCEIWDEKEVEAPWLSDGGAGSFVTTAYRDATHRRLCTRESRVCTHMFTDFHKSEFKVVAAPEEFVVRIEHAIQSPKFYNGRLHKHFEEAHVHTTGSHRAMKGRLMSHDGVTLKEFPIANTRDIFTLGELLSAAKVNLSEVSDAMTDVSDPAKTPGTNTMRHAGVVLFVALEYGNVKDHDHLWFAAGDTEYTYRVLPLPETAFDVTEVTTSNASFRAIRQKTGVRVYIAQQGRIARFSFQILVINVMSALGLLALASTAIDLLALYILPSAPRYFDYKYSVKEPLQLMLPAKHFPLPSKKGSE